MDCRLPGSSVHGILHARILEWVAIPFSRRSSQPRYPTQVFHIAGRVFTVWASRKFRVLCIYLCFSIFRQWVRKNFAFYIQRELNILLDFTTLKFSWTLSSLEGISVYKYLFPSRYFSHSSEEVTWVFDHFLALNRLSLSKVFQSNSISKQSISKDLHKGQIFYPANFICLSPNLQYLTIWRFETVFEDKTFIYLFICLF